MLLVAVGANIIIAEALGGLRANGPSPTENRTGAIDSAGLVLADRELHQGTVAGVVARIVIDLVAVIAVFPRIDHAIAAASPAIALISAPNTNFPFLRCQHATIAAAGLPARIDGTENLVSWRIPPRQMVPKYIIA
jgi:hypothetical protein